MLEDLAIKGGWKAVKVIASLVLLGCLAFGGYSAVHNYRQDMAELKNLREFKTSVDAQNEVSDAAATIFHAQTSAAADQSATLASQRALIDQLTEQTASEDPATADFLDMPIPQRLRDADRAAREQRQLDSGEGAR